MRSKLKDHEVRKIYSHGNSLRLTLPREILNELKWRKGQKLIIRRRGEKIVVEDWDGR